MSIPKSHTINCRFYTDRLYAKSSYLFGLANLFNIAGNYCKYNYSKSPEEADLRALAADWEITAEDLQKALDIIRLKYNFNVEPPAAPDTSTRRELATSSPKRA
jgi:hypothetical protein